MLTESQVYIVYSDLPQLAIDLDSDEMIQLQASFLFGDGRELFNITLKYSKLENT